jgi:hypothetical protein
MIVDRINIDPSFKYAGTLADDATFSLPTIVASAFGVVVVGNDEERATFTIDNTGAVNLLLASASITINTDVDTDAKFCLGTSVANPVIVKNRLGSSKAVLLLLWQV